MRRERGLDAGEGRAAIRTEYFVTTGGAEPAGAQPGFGEPVIGGIIIRVAVPVALPRPARDIGELHILRERLAAREAQPPGLVRQSIALNRDLVLIDQISETAHRTDGGAITDDRENIVAADRLRARARAVAPVHRPNAPAVGQIGAEARRLADLQAHGIIGLLVLAKPRRADEALVGEFDPLAAGG